MFAFFRELLGDKYNTETQKLFFNTGHTGSMEVKTCIAE